MADSILCVIDFSESSRKALQWAVANAVTHQSHITILHPYRLTRGQYGESPVDLRKKIEADAKRNFGILEEDLLRNKSISYDFRSEVGFIADRVENHTRNHPVSCMVVDKSMRAENKESFDQLVDSAKIPLVIIS